MFKVEDIKSVSKEVGIPSMRTLYYISGTDGFCRSITEEEYNAIVELMETVLKEIELSRSDEMVDM